MEYAIDDRERALVPSLLVVGGDEPRDQAGETLGRTIGVIKLGPVHGCEEVQRGGLLGLPVGLERQLPDRWGRGGLEYDVWWR
jgi:hypothetical protein